MTAALHFLDYRLNWRVGEVHPGRHRSAARGDGSEFRGHSPWFNARDARRFDVRASVRDPFRRLMVRDYNQRSAAPVYVLADLSASMGFRGQCNKLELLADFVASLAFSANRSGDPFAFIGCGDRVLREWLLPLRRARGYGFELATRLRTAQPRSNEASGLLQGAAEIGPRRSIVFLASDYHLPLSLVAEVLSRLRRHQVIPVVLRDSAEFRLPARFGLAWIRDLESGRRRALWVRRRLREKTQAAVNRRREKLDALLYESNCRALVIEDRFSADEVNRYFWT